ncbi:MAG: hypothetical protein KC442_08640 [Thermomicrobiales bacterium]|nr:hypothetical protein [Thermomicrobiales bacterium]
MSDPRETTVKSDAANQLYRRRLVHLLAGSFAGMALGLRGSQNLAARGKHRRRRAGGTLHQHKDNPTAHPSHPFHRISQD